MTRLAMLAAWTGAVFVAVGGCWRVESDVRLTASDRTPGAIPPGSGTEGQAVFDAAGEAPSAEGLVARSDAELGSGDPRGAMTAADLLRRAMSRGSEAATVRLAALLDSLPEAASDSDERARLALLAGVRDPGLPGSSGGTSPGDPVARVRERAERGDPDAGFEMGVLCAFGMTPGLEPRDALMWFETAARNGHEGARWETVWRHLRSGEAQAAGSALDWLWSAAERGDARAAVALSRIIRPGMDGADRIASMLDLAAARGDTAAAYEAGIVHLRRGGVPERGMEWLRIAAARGLPEAKARLGLVLFRDPNHRGESEELLRSAADAGVAQAQRGLGLTLLRERDARSAQDGIGWLTSAASQGDPLAQLALATVWSRGEFTGRDDTAARRWFTMAADQGVPVAGASLARFLFDGIGGPRDTSEGLRRLGSAAERGLVPAQVLLATTYERGTGGVEPSRELAMQWYERAARSGEPVAQYALAVMLSESGSEAHDLEQALVWLIRAGEGGVEAAADRIGVVESRLSAETVGRARAHARMPVSGEAPWANADDPMDGVLQGAAYCVSVGRDGSMVTAASAVRDRGEVRVLFMGSIRRASVIEVSPYGVALIRVTDGLSSAPGMIPLSREGAVQRSKYRCLARLFGAAGTTVPETESCAFDGPYTLVRTGSGSAGRRPLGIPGVPVFDAGGSLAALVVGRSEGGTREADVAVHVGRFRAFIEDRVEVESGEKGADTDETAHAAMGERLERAIGVVLRE